MEDDTSSLGLESRVNKIKIDSFSRLRELFPEQTNPHTLLETLELKDNFLKDENELEKLSEQEILDDFFKNKIQSSADTKGIYSVTTENPFKEVGLPKGYGFKGGAARDIMRIFLGLDRLNVRDFDLICFGGDESLSSSLAEKYSPDDFATGYGAEHITSINESIYSQDFTINECMFLDDVLYFTQ